jgi:polyhydroxybutyrate depolymerase
MRGIAPSKNHADNAVPKESPRNTGSGRRHAGLGCPPKPVFFLSLLLGCLVLLTASTARAATPLVHRQWTVDGVVREALVYAPASARTNAAPLVFAFHGHGGSMQNAAHLFGFHKLWPEAIVVYMQGLNTPGRLTDPDGTKPGWQKEAGDQGDRDLKFFDAVLASLRQDYRVDEKRIYASGHSNGGGFTYLLWAMRGETFAAFAPSAAVEARDFSRLKPKPVLHVAGEKDTLVKFAWQQKMMAALRRLNQCGEGQPWEGEKNCTIYPSKLGAPVVTLIHPGPHLVPAGAPASIVKFFQEHPQP